MIYSPQNKNPISLLIEIGFTNKHDGARGWIRERRKSNDTPYTNGRLHALLRENTIDIHLDKFIDGDHVTKKFNNAVKQAIKELRKADL